MCDPSTFTPLRLRVNAALESVTMSAAMISCSRDSTDISCVGTEPRLSLRKSGIWEVQAVTVAMEVTSLD